MKMELCAKLWLGGDVRKVSRDEAIQMIVQSQAGRLPRRVDSIATFALFGPIQLVCKFLDCKIVFVQV